MQWFNAIQCGKQDSNMSFHLGHCSAPWYTPTKHKQKNFCTHFDPPLATSSYLGWKMLFSFSFLLIQLSARTDNDSLGLEVREKNYTTTKRDVWKPAVTGNTLQNFVYNLLQLWFQAHGCYFYAFLLNKTVKIKSKLQEEERKHRILKYLSSIEYIRYKW